MTLVVPRGGNLREAHQFLRSQAGWVFDRRAAMQREQQRIPPGHILLHGVETSVRVEEAHLCHPAVLQESDGLRVMVPIGHRDRADAALAARLRTKANSELPEEVARHAARTGLRPARVTVRDARTRWGSCSRKGAISLNWRLVMAPPGVVSYVVLHELAHLREHHHGAAFWSLVAKLCPDHEAARRWLRRWGPRLLAPLHFGDAGRAPS